MVKDFSEEWDKKENDEDKNYNNAYQYLKNLGERVGKLELEVKNIKYRQQLQEDDQKKIALDIVIIKKTLNIR